MENGYFTRPGFAFILIILSLPIFFISIKFSKSLVMLLVLMYFLIGCYLIFESLRLRKIAKGNNIDLSADITTKKKEDIDFGMIFGFSLGVATSTIMFSIVIVLISLNINPFPFIYAYIIGFFTVPIAMSVYRKKLISLGFSRDRLPISLIDLLIAGLIFYLAYLTKLRYIIIILGLIFALSAVLLIIKKKRINY